MELWIRSQDRLIFEKISMVRIAKEDDYKILGYVSFGVFLLGEYKTKQRALEILDEISSKIKNSYLIKNEMLLSSKDIKEQLNTFKEALNGSAIIQTPAYDIEPINTNIVYYEMPKE